MKRVNRIRLKVLPILLVALLGCARDDEFTTRVSGKVVNRYTQEPIEGVYVFLVDGMSTSGFGTGWNTSSDKRVEGYTDADGEFFLELTGEFEALLGVSKEGYYEFDSDPNDGIALEVKGYGYGGNYENQVLVLEAQAGFNPLFNSTVPVNFTDSLIVFSSYTKPDVPPDELKDWLNVGWNTLCIGQQTCRFVSNAKPGELTAPAKGDTYEVYQIAYTRNGQWESKIDSVYIKSFEVYTDTIYY